MVSRPDSSGRSLLRTKFFGIVVQLVRTPACHAGGREFESRRSRQKKPGFPGFFILNIPILSMFYLYILYSKSIDHYYIGQTSDLDGRLRRHNNSSSRFTSRATDWQIIYFEEYPTRSEAAKRESFIKKMKSRSFIMELTGHAGGRPE